MSRPSLSPRKKRLRQSTLDELFLLGGDRRKTRSSSTMNDDDKKKTANDNSSSTANEESKKANNSNSISNRVPIKPPRKKFFAPVVVAVPVTKRDKCAEAALQRIKSLNEPKMDHTPGDDDIPSQKSPPTTSAVPEKPKRKSKSPSKSPTFGTDTDQPSTSTIEPPETRSISPKTVKIPALSHAFSLGPDISTFSSAAKTSLAHLRPTANHTVLVKTNTLNGNLPPEPYPCNLIDKWDADHVRMPFSSHNLYPVSDETQSDPKVVSRWQLITDALAKAHTWTSSVDIEEAILSYNTRYSNKWNFRGLHKFFNEEISREQSKDLFGFVLPNMAKLVLDLPNLCTQPIPLLKRGSNHKLTLSQQQAASLLANAFFCTFPSRNVSKGKRGDSDTYPRINFNGIFGLQQRSIEKLRCLLHYFHRVCTQMPTGLITFERRICHTFPYWLDSTKQLGQLHVSKQGTIEDYGIGMLQMDFANKFVGGGVLGHGCVQEEIRFLVCPEMIVSGLVTQVLDDNECLFMTGCERFSYYGGYADTFEWTGPYKDTTPRDTWSRRQTVVVALDALPFHRFVDQFRFKSIIRELNKAYVGFNDSDQTGHVVSAVATGNWGCGAFGGDKQIKSLIQLMAAAETGRNMAYFTFDDDDMMRDLYEIHQLLIKHQQNVGQIFSYIHQYYETWLKDRKRSELMFSLFEYVKEVLEPTLNDGPKAETSPEPFVNDEEDTIVPETPPKPSLLSALEKCDENN